MTKLKLNFLDNPHQVDQPNLIEILEDFGKEICEYGKDYFSYYVNFSSEEGVLTDFSLYILAPEIGYDYRVVNVKIINVAKLSISFYILINRKTLHYKVDISNGTHEYENKLNDIFNNPLFNASLKFLVDQTLLKKD